MISDLKASNASLLERCGANPDDSTLKLGSATEKLVQLTEQNAQLHTALRRARDHILLQDRMLKEARAKEPTTPLYQEAIQSFETQVREKELEIERLRQELLKSPSVAKDPQSLMTAAWYDIGKRRLDWTASSPDASPPSTWLKTQRDRL